MKLVLNAAYRRVGGCGFANHDGGGDEVLCGGLNAGRIIFLLNNPFLERISAESQATRPDAN